MSENVNADEPIVWISIDGTALPTPTKCPITEYDMDSAESGRAESGYMHRERIRESLLDLKPQWDNLTAAEANLIRDAITPAEFEVTVRFLGTTYTRTMYAGDRNWEPVYVNGSEHWTLSTHFTEY